MFPTVVDDDVCNKEEEKRRRKRDANIGPPFLVYPEDYEKALEPYGVRYIRPDEEIDDDDDEVFSYPFYESPHTHPSRQGQELVAWWSINDNDDNDTKTRDDDYQDELVSKL